MIVVRDGPTLLLVTQNDHAHFSGELLSLWRDDGLPENPRRVEIMFAARHHDNGWREADAAPRVDPRTGAPYDFLRLPAEDRAEIWRRGVRRYRDQRPYAALLIHQHAIELHRSPGAEGEYRELLEELRASRDELVTETGGDEETLAADYPLVRATDLLSLQACRCFSTPREYHGRRSWLEGEDLVIDPLPLVGSTRFGIPCRRIERRRYRGDADLAGALGEARWDTLEVRVRGT